MDVDCLTALRMLFRNVSSWPEVAKAEVFPSEQNPVIFSCRKFYTSGDYLVLIPSKDMGLGDPPMPSQGLTQSLGVAVIKINIPQYVSLVRGEKALHHQGSLVLRWFLKRRTVECCKTGSCFAIVLGHLHNWLNQERLRGHKTK